MCTVSFFMCAAEVSVTLGMFQVVNWHGLAGGRMPWAVKLVNCFIRCGVMHWNCEPLWSDIYCTTWQEDRELLCQVPAGSPSLSGNITVYVGHKPNELAHTFFFLLFSSCVYFCLYGPFNCISLRKFSRQLSVFSHCSSGFSSALLVLSTIYLFMKVSFRPDVLPMVDWTENTHQLTVKLWQCYHRPYMMLKLSRAALCGQCWLWQECGIAQKYGTYDQAELCELTLIVADSLLQCFEECDLDYYAKDHNCIGTVLA